MAWDDQPEGGIEARRLAEVRPPQAVWVSDLTGVTGVGWVVSYFGSHEKVLKEGRENNTMKIAFDAREMVRGVLEKCSG